MQIIAAFTNANAQVRAKKMAKKSGFLAIPGIDLTKGSIEAYGHVLTAIKNVWAVIDPTVEDGCVKIETGCYGIAVTICKNGSGDGSITSDLYDNLRDQFQKNSSVTNQKVTTAINVLESIILAHANAGINIKSPAYLEGIETAIDAIANSL